MGDKKELDKWNFDNDGNQAEDHGGVELDRTTGLPARVGPSNTFDDNNRFDGALGDLTTVLDEDGKTRLIAKQNLPADHPQAVSQNVQVSESDEGEFAAYENLPQSTREFLSEDGYDNVVAEIEALRDHYTPSQFEQTMGAVNGMSRGAQDALIEVMGRGKESNTGITQIYDDVLRLLGPRDKASFQNGFEKFPDVFRDQWGEEGEE